MGYEIDQVAFTLYTGKEITGDQKFNPKQEQDKAKQKKFDFTVMPIYPKDYKIKSKNKFELDQSVHIPSDMVTNNWKNVVIRLSNLDLDSSDVEQSKLNKFQLKQEIGYAAFLGVYAIIIPFPSNPNCPNYLRFIQKQSQNYGFASCQVWMAVPLVANDKQDNWNLFQSIKQCLSLQDKVLGVSLQLRSNLPNEKVIARWQGENIRSIELPTNIFQANSKGLPVLPKAHELCISSFFKYQPNYIISPSKQGGNQDMQDQDYRNYLCYVFGKQKAQNEEDMYAVDYYDVLQNPLQPYKHNLESGTYQVFEADEPKYNLYEEAVYKTLLEKDKDSTTIIFLVGAGRAPILKRALKAADRANRKIYLYAIEKNPYAIQSIKHQQKQNAKSWDGRVELVPVDMRVWEPKEKADIILSELLGSFGDNELSPECLLWAEKHLKEGGISIPKNYTSFITPVSCQNIYDRTDCKNTTYLVYMNTKYYASDIKSVFTFTHPNPNQQFKQFKSLEFNFTENNYIHGFAGFFESYLHEKVLMSINPDTHTPDMLSWFPVFFPFAKPCFVQKSDRMIINIWRKATKSKIWYEWSYEVYSEKETNFPYLRSAIYNLEGKGSNILL